MENNQEVNPGEHVFKEVLDINGEMIQKIELVKDPENYEEEGERMDWDRMREQQWKREMEEEAYDLDLDEEEDLV